jgi:hypothetical protein
MSVHLSDTLAKQYYAADIFHAEDQLLAQGLKKNFTSTPLSSEKFSLSQLSEDMQLARAVNVNVG